jgi:hypothetical protein
MGMMFSAVRTFSTEHFTHNEQLTHVRSILLHFPQRDVAVMIQFPGASRGIFPGAKKQFAVKKVKGVTF